MESPKQQAYNAPSEQGMRTPDATMSTWLAWALFSMGTLVLYSTGVLPPWLVSGCGVETVLILHGGQHRLFPFIPLWTLLATLNLVYAVSATSWLLYWCFATLCYLAIVLTCLFQYDWCSHTARSTLRKLLRGLHFTRDRIALFSLPALEIDTDVNGLMVVRGLTISLSNLTVLVHGVELGVKLFDDIELAAYCDDIHIALFRTVEVGDIFASIKGGKPEMMFADVDGDSADADEHDDDDSIFERDTALLRAATFGSETYKERPSLKHVFTGNSWMQDSTAKDGLQSVQTLSPDDEQAEKQYLAKLKDIRNTSPVVQARHQIQQRKGQDDTLKVETDEDARAAMCAELQSVPAIVHPPDRSIRVTTLQQWAPEPVRRFVQRMPLLYRLVLSPIAYFHPITFRCISLSGSGKWLTAMMQQKVFKDYVESNSDLRRLSKRLGAWLGGANFSIHLADIEGVAQFPINPSYDIIAQMQLGDIVSYRTAPQSQSITQVVRLAGAQASFFVPTFLFPHHEHLLPPKPDEKDLAEQKQVVERAHGDPKTVQAENELDKMKKDETIMKISAHASLPASFDQSLLNFIAALVKATKLIEVEKQLDDGEDSPAVPDSPPSGDEESIKSLSRVGTGSLIAAVKSGLKGGTSSIPGDETDGMLKKGTTRQVLQDFASRVSKSTAVGLKKAVVGGIVNDRWIARLVGKIAAKLQTQQADVGYSGEIPIPLGPYRKSVEAKILP